MTSTYDPYLAIGAMLFMLGVIGFITRRNLLMMMLSVELMLHGVSLTFLTFGQMHGSMEGQVFVVFVLTVATCEAGIALALILSLYQRTKSLDVELWTALFEDSVPRRKIGVDDEMSAEEPEPLRIPTLPTAGYMPDVSAGSTLGSQRGPRTRLNDGPTVEYGDPDDDFGEHPPR